MTTLLFDRAYHLELSIPRSTIETPLVDVTQEDRVIITESRMELKTNYSTSNNATTSPIQTLVLYNLDSKFLEAFKKSGVRVKLRAGYLSQLSDKKTLQDLPLVLNTEVVACKARFLGVDSILELKLAELATDKKARVTQVKLQKGTSLGNALLQLGKELSKDVSVTLSDELLNKRIQKTRSYSGTPDSILQTFAKEFSLEVYTQNSILNISDRGLTSLSQFSALGVAPFNIAYEDILDGVDISTDYSKAVGGSSGIEVSFSILFDSRFVLGSVFNIFSRTDISHQVLGSYKVIAVSNSLDTHGNKWHTSITAEPIKGVGVTSVEALYDDVIYTPRRPNN